MKLFYFSLFFLLVAQSGSCQSSQTENRNDVSINSSQEAPRTEDQDDKEIVLLQKANKKYGVTAIFYGINIAVGGEKKSDVIQHIVFRDDKSGKEFRYRPSEDSTSQATDFYFTDVWSPNEEFIALPLGKREGFGIFQAKDALAKIKENKYFDKIKVKSINSGDFWHNFEKWENDSTFSFRAGLDGEMFLFKYDLANSQLECYAEKCDELDTGKNNKGEIKPIRKGDIEPTKSY